MIGAQPVLVVDDHPLFAAALRDVLQTLAPNCTVTIVGTLSAAQSYMARATYPALVLLDLNLPDSAGAQTLRQLPSLFESVPVVVLSSLDDPLRIRQALSAGARAFISKSERPERIVEALTRVLSQDLSPSPQLPTPHPVSQLSARQREVLDLIATGKSNKEIARDLGMAVGTVKVHVRDIFERLNTRNRTEAVALYTSMDLPRDADHPGPAPAAARPD